jgi:hypothetical protein
MPVGLLDTRFLDSARINRVVQTLASNLEVMRPLVYLDRLNLNPADDDEILARFSGNIIAADIIADDQEAVVQDSGKVELSTNAIPNIKLGQRVGQGKLNLIKRLESIGGLAGEAEQLLGWEQRFGMQLVTGVRQRLNALACAMMLDSANYNRLGIVLSGATWGMPSKLNVTPSTPWSTAASAVPIDDIFGMDQVGTDNYGTTYDKLTMSSQAFRYMVATTQFANQASIPLQAHYLVAATSLPTKDLRTMMNVAGQILNKTVVIDDATYGERSNAGAPVIRRRYLPANQVLLSRSQDERDNAVMDIGNGVTTESLVGDVSSGLIGENPFAAGGQYGPVSYFTRRPDLNPPDTVAWAVARAFPRKFVPESTAVLTVY